MSIHNTTPRFEKAKIPRFHRLDVAHISAIEALYTTFPFLRQRMEIHMPFSRARSTFSSGSLWLWPKFDKRPVGYLIFLEGFSPCIWYPERQEGMTFRWLLPPSFSQQGATICLANLLAGESVLQMEDIIVYEGRDLWSHQTFSERWASLRQFWHSLPPDQPLLAFQPRVVTPIPLSEWHLHYHSAVYWIIQTDQARQPRWYWRDVVTVVEHKPVEFIAPVMKRSAEIISVLCALCLPYANMSLPDTYSLVSQEGTALGMASLPNMAMSLELRGKMVTKGLPVEVVWKPAFQKYQVTRILPEHTPITTASFFFHRT